MRKKFILGLLVVAVFVGTAAGCRGNNDAELSELAELIELAELEELSELEELGELSEIETLVETDELFDEELLNSDELVELAELDELLELSELDELDELGLRYYFQFTLNNYPKMLEPRVPDFNNRIETFLGLSERLGAARVIWRYDPIIISNLTSYEFHLRNFARIADSLKGATQQVMVSMLDFYQKTSRHLCELKQRGIVFDREADSSMDVNELMRGIAQIAKSNGMAIFSCAEERDFTEVGVPPGHCIDEYLLHSLWEFPCKNKKDPGQRKQCGCAVSKDIGINNTCIHGCPYCYATGNCTIASRRYHEHNPSSPAMWEYRKL